MKDKLVKSILNLPDEDRKVVIKKTADMLAELFPKRNEKPTYSLGFQKYEKLNKKQRMALQTKFWGRPFKDITEALETQTIKEILAN
jgi:hypothetical protein